MIGKLVAVQTALKAPKGQFNSFGKYSYRSCEDILEAVKPLLSENGLLLTLTDEPVMVGERTYIKATASVTDGEKAVSATAYAREEDEKKGMDGSQVTGTASSYARKYALNGLFLIDDTKDADTMDNRPKAAQKAAKPARKAAGAAGRAEKAPSAQAVEFARLKAACAAYEASHPRPDAEDGWALAGVQKRPDLPPRDAPDEERAAWFAMVADEFESCLADKGAA